MSSFTSLPILRSIIDVEAKEEMWILHLDINRMRESNTTLDSFIQFLERVGFQVISSKPREIIVAAPVDVITTPLDALDEYISSVLGEYLRSYQPRKLTEAELEEIIASLPRVFSPVPEVAEHARREIQARVKEQLREIEITPLGLADLKNAIIKQFEKGRVEPGSTVGLSVAEALSALTQAALNAFHQSGSRSNVATGVDMLQDLLNVRQERETESCTIHFKDKNLGFNEIFEKRKEIVAVTIGSLIVDYTLEVPQYFDEKWWVANWPLLSGQELPAASKILELQVNVPRMVAYDITMSDIAQAIESHNDPNIITCICGPINEGLIYIYPNEEEIISTMSDKIPTFGNAVDIFFSETFLYSLDSVVIKGIPGINYMTPISTLTWLIVADEKQYDDTWVLYLSRYAIAKEGIPPEKLVILLQLLNYEIVEVGELTITIRSPLHVDNPPSEYVSSSINAADQVEDERRRRRIEARKERLLTRQSEEVVTILDRDTQISKAGHYYYASTEGSNLSALFARRDVDGTTTSCNNPNVILRLLGIEATRNLLIQEFTFILENASLQLDPRHLILLADFMTNRGSLLPISFWGIVRQNPGPLTVSSMGRSLDIFRTAAAFGEEEEIKTISSSVFVNRRAKIGSGYVDLKIDEQKLADFEKKKSGVSAQSVESAIQELDNLSFGIREETGISISAMDELLAMTASSPIEETQKGTGERAPVPAPTPAPVISKLIIPQLDRVVETKTIPAAPVKRTIPTKKAIPTRRVIRKPLSVNIPSIAP